MSDGQQELFNPAKYYSDLCMACLSAARAKRGRTNNGEKKRGNRWCRVDLTLDHATPDTFASFHPFSLDSSATMPSPNVLS
jgi:hypothetical protein